MVRAQKVSSRTVVECLWSQQARSGVPRFGIVSYENGRLG
jgi:hypothetical protein